MNDRLSILRTNGPLVSYRPVEDTQRVLAVSPLDGVLLCRGLKIVDAMRVR